MTQSQPTQVQTEAQSTPPSQLEVPGADEDTSDQQVDSEANMQQASALSQPVAHERQPETQPPSQTAAYATATPIAEAGAGDNPERQPLSEGELPRTHLPALNVAAVTTEGEPPSSVHVYGTYETGIFWTFFYRPDCICCGRDLDCHKNRDAMLQHPKKRLQSVKAFHSRPR